MLGDFRAPQLEQTIPPKPALWYPAAAVVSPGLPTVGPFADGYPVGAIVRLTNGRYGLAELDLARQRGETFFLIDEAGGVHQGAPLDRWGRIAAGGPTFPRHVGIALENPGLLRRDGRGFRTEWGAVVRPELVRIVRAPDANRWPGTYHRASAAQEDALVGLLAWLKANNPAVFDLQQVVGHDEVSAGRRHDPGGALSVTMPELRRHLEGILALQLAKGVEARSA